MRKVQVSVRMEIFGDVATDKDYELITSYADANNIYEALCAAFEESLIASRENGRKLPEFGRKNHSSTHDKESWIKYDITLMHAREPETFDFIRRYGFSKLDWKKFGTIPIEECKKEIEETRIKMPNGSPLHLEMKALFDEELPDSERGIRYDKLIRIIGGFASIWEANNNKKED